MNGALEAFHFLRPWWLLLILLATFLWWQLRQGADTTTRWASVIAPDILRALTLGEERRSRFAPHDLLLLAWILGCLAVAGPTWKQEPSPFADARPPAMVILRVSASMKAEDLAPSRLERAVQKLSDLLALREGASTGLIAYNGSVHLVLPPTPDKDVVIAMAQALSPEIMPRDGDSLADAVRLAATVLQEGRKGGSILIMTDAVAPDQVALLRNTVAGEVRFEASLWAAMPPVRLDEAEDIHSAASSLHGSVQAMAPDRSDVQSISARLDRATAVSDVAGEGERWQEAGYWLTPLLALLALAWFRQGWVVGS